MSIQIKKFDKTIIIFNQGENQGCYQGADRAQGKVEDGGASDCGIAQSAVGEREEAQAGI